MAFGLAFVITILIGIFGGEHTFNTIRLIRQLIGGIIGGYIVGDNINGIIYEGIPAGLAGLIGSPLSMLLFGSGITIPLSRGMLLIVTIILAINFLIIY